MRALGTLGMLIALVLGWLSFGDRRSSVALSVVELEGKLGVPLALPVAVIALALLLIPSRRSAPPRLGAPAATATTPRNARAPLAAPALETQGWLAALQGQAGRLPLEAGARVQVEPGRNPPVQLVLERLTPERARRSVELFAELLATMPTPPRACVRYEGCVAGTSPRHIQVVAAMRRYFSGEAFVATQHEEVVELVFQAPDARWREAARTADLRST